LLLTVPNPVTAVHELGHALGLPHAEGAGRPPTADEGAPVPLPYPGIGGVGYSPLERGTVYDKADTSDIMSYAPRRWTSPKTWQFMFDEIRAESGVSGPKRIARTAAAAPRYERRRLVSGVVVNDKATIIDPVTVDSAEPPASGPVVARVVGLDDKGHAVAAADIHGEPAPAHSEPAPFLVALSPTGRIASLQVQQRGKALARLRASKHRPRGRFVRLRKRASAKRPLRVRWAAKDRDRHDRLSVVLLARRGRGEWQTITMGPARFRAPVDLKSLGKGKKLALRLMVSDGFTTTAVTRRVRVAGRG
jgi:hypothetical protein